MKSEELFLNKLAQTSPNPLKIEVSHAEGSFIHDANGKRYFDLISGIGVTNIGHRHPKVIGAIKAQLDKYMHVMPYGELVQAPQIKLADKLTGLLPPSLNCCYFVNSGTEANEGALKLAKRITGRTGIVSFKNSYHGSTHGSLSVSGNELKKNSFRPLLPDVSFIDFNVKNELDKISRKTACVIIEPIQGDAGVRIPDKNYLKALRAQCDKTGAILIFDEVQTGFGRTGSMFAFEQFDVVPDILTLAKGMGGGMPIGAFIANKRHMALLTHNPMLGHITTFGGHPVNCVAASANLDVLCEKGLLENVEAKGQLIENLLQHAAIKEIRRKGMMMAIEFENIELVKRIINECLKKGVITFYFLSCPTSFRLAPPLNISNEEIETSCKLVMEAIETVVQ